MRRALCSLLSVAALAAPGLARAQDPLGGRVVPETFRPRTDVAPPAIDLGNFSGQPTPASAETVLVRPGAVRFEGDPLPDPGAGERLKRDLVRTADQAPVSVAEIFGRVAQLEQELSAGGYVLTRVLTPPQRIEPGGALVLRVVNGCIDSIDVGALPEGIRRPVERRLKPLVGRAPLTLAEIERALLLAGELGGLSLRSTVATGDTPGGVKLVLDGVFHGVTGAAGIDRLASERVGDWGVNGSVAVNSALGFGEQVYLAYQGDLKTVLEADARMRIVALGGVVPLGASGLTLGPEVVWARIRPLPLPSVPDSRNELLRATVRVSAPVVRTRETRMVAQASLETLAQRVSAIDFGADLSADSYLALRAGIDVQHVSTGSLLLLGSASLSRGLGDIASPFEVDADTPSTHQGAAATFTRANVLLGARVQGDRLHGSVAVRGQTAFGEPLFNSEQLSLDGPDGMSSLSPGAFAVDQGFTARGEFGTRRTLPWGLPGVAEPYVFGALGGGEVNEADAAPEREIRGAELGLGVRTRLGRIGPFNTPVSLNLEVGRNWINSLENSRDTRVGFLLGWSF